MNIQIKIFAKILLSFGLSFSMVMSSTKCYENKKKYIKRTMNAKFINIEEK